MISAHWALWPLKPKAPATNRSDKSEFLPQGSRVSGLGPRSCI